MGGGGLSWGGGGGTRGMLLLSSFSSRIEMNTACTFLVVTLPSVLTIVCLDWAEWRPAGLGEGQFLRCNVISVFNF